MKTLLMTLALLASSVPVLTAQSNAAWWEALHYSEYSGLVSSSGDTLVARTEAMTELFLVISRGGKLERTLVATEPGYGNLVGDETPGVVSTLDGMQGSRDQLVAQRNALAVTRAQLNWREDVQDHIVAVTDPVVMKTFPASAKESWKFLSTLTIDGRAQFGRELSLQPKRLEGTDVWVLQRCLVDQGFTEVGEVDGWFGPATKKAVMRFQERLGLPATGVVDSALWEELIGPEAEPENYEGD